MTLTRRTFAKWVAGAVPIALVTRRADALSSAWIAGELDTLTALAGTVLPSEIGAAGAAKVAADFLRWMNEYKEGAEVVHGYGTSQLRFLGASPKPAWAVQLERIGTRYSALGTRPTTEQKREVIRDELKNERTDRMPAVATAPHVALALMSFYFGSSDAADLCYEARIGRQTCRPLMNNPRKPLPITGAAR